MRAPNESTKLIGLVHCLCARLQRPVSSKDLLHFFREDPELRPLLFQRPGQLLFKLSRRRRQTAARIFQIGIISNLAFYAPTCSQQWMAAMEAHRDIYELAEQCHLRMPEHTARLIATRFDAFARNALVGFVQEFKPAYERQRNSPSEVVTEFSGLLDLAQRHAAESFILRPPEKLIARKQAGEILSEEYARRMQLADLVSMNVGRHLVHLKWPQSPFCGAMTGMFWEEQVFAYCVSRWPVNATERSLGKGISLAMRYGMGPLVVREN